MNRLIQITFGKIFFSLALLFASNAQAEANRVTCRTDLSALQFVGQPFSNGTGLNEAFCVGPAHTDAEGIAACERFGGGRFTAVNPGNPQYGLGLQPEAENTLSRNSAGFYFCVPKETNSKQRMCVEADRRNIDGLSYRWQPSESGNDGNCMCRRGNGPETTNCTDLVAEAEATPPPEEEEPEIVVTASRPSDDDTQAASADNSRARNEFVACVENAAARAAACERGAQTAVSSCNPDNARNGSGNTQAAVGEVLGAAGSIYAQANANTGTQAECFKAGLIANGARMVLNPASTSCRDNVQGCQADCGEAKYEEYRQSCGEILARVRPGLTIDVLEQEVESTPEGEALSRHDAGIREKFVSGARICQQGRQSQDTLNNLLTGLGNALQQSMICACQTSSSAMTGATPTTPDQAVASNCASSIPNPNDCQANPTLPNCSLYDSMNVCTPGAGYNAAACNCQMNPRSAGCPGATAGEGASNFAGATIGARPGDTVSFGGLAGVGGGRASGIDLSGSEEASEIALRDGGGKRGAEVLPQIGGSGGSKGGGAAAAGGPASLDMPVGEGESKGLSGMMTFLTTRAARYLGMRPRTNGNIRVKKPGQAGGPDIGKFRPRGLASTGVGTKNMDIWRMMNMCVQGDTCKRNVNNYITGP